MNISKQHITNKRKLIGPMKPEYITIHSTGNPNSTAQNERDNLNRPSNTSVTGFHYAVGDNIVIECIPPTTKAYHAGDGANGTGNSKSIGIEMVESGNRDKVIANTIELVKHLQQEFNISNDKVVRHHDWSGKNCPRILNYNNWQGWNDFKSKLTATDDYYRVKVNWTDSYKEQKGSFQNIKYAIARAVEVGPPYKVFDSEGKQVYPEPNASPYDKHFESLNAKGIVVHEKRYNDPITRGEMMALLDRATDIKK